MSRALYFFERFLFAGGRSPWNIVVAVRRPGPLDEESLRVSLANLQRRHAMLRIGINGPARRPTFIDLDPPPPIPVRIVDDAGESAWFDEALSELERPFELARGPLARLVWVRSVARSDLVMILPHCVSDGSSKLVLIRQLLRGLDHPVQEHTPPPGLFCLEDLFEPPGSGAKRRIRARAVVARLFVAAAPLLPSRGASRPHSPLYGFAWTIEPDRYRPLAEHCRREKVTPYFAMAAALLRAARAVDPARVRNRLNCPVGMRRYVPALRPDMVFPYSPFVTLSLDPALDQDFWEQTRRLRADLSTSGKRLDPAKDILAGELLHDLCDRFIDLQLRGRIRSDLAFSLLGDLNLPGGDGANPPIGLASLASTPWPDAMAVYAIFDRDRMSLIFIAREAMLPRETAERLRDTAMELLVSHVGSVSTPRDDSTNGDPLGALPKRTLPNLTDVSRPSPRRLPIGVVAPVTTFWRHLTTATRGAGVPGRTPA